MIDLEKVKMVLYDFDDTLCIHEDHSSSKDSDAEYDVRVLKDGYKAWPNARPNSHMGMFMQKCKEHSIRQGLISATVSYQHDVAKHEWVCHNYGIALENFCVGTFEDKLRIMIAISTAYDIPREQILIIDDLYENLERAANNGFMAATPMEVVNFMG